eukprot:1843984-Amphidinium_carterae.3
MKAATTTSGWGNCLAVATFNLNRFPWHKLGSWLNLLEGEVKWSVLALQENFDDTGVEDGWYDVSGHQILLTRTRTKQLTGLVLHSSFAPVSPPCYETGEGSVATTISIEGMAIRVFPFSNRLLMGDLNGWLGRSVGDSYTSGPYNLSKTNNRGLELLEWIDTLRLKDAAKTSCQTQISGSTKQQTLETSPIS